MMQNMDNAKKRRVLHVLKSSVYSGAENVVITIIKNLSDAFDFLYLATEGTVRERLEQEEIPFLLLKKFNRGNLARVIHEWQPDVVHAHDFSATVFCATVPGQFRLISHLHYDPPWVKRWNGKTILYLLLKNRISRVLTVSEKSFWSMIFAKHFVSKWVMVGNPIDVESIRHMAEESFPENQEDSCDLLFVGRFVEQKDPQRFIRLVSMLKQGGWNDIRCWMLGAGELLAECKNMVEKMGLQQNVSIKGFQRNPYMYMKRSKMMCITSRWEGFGLVVLEANILGIPVLSTPNAGCSEILGDNAEELYDTDEQCLRKIELLRQNFSEYEAWKDRAQDRAVRYDNIDNYMTKMSCIYRNEV